MKNNQKTDLQPFTNLYPVQKTLRFALRPVGRTQEHIQEKGLLETDEELSRKYKVAKKIIDEYHKDYIHRRLGEFSFSKEELESYRIAFNNWKNDKSHDSKIQKEVDKQQSSLRKKIAQHLKNDRLFKQELIKNDLPEWLKTHSINEALLVESESGKTYSANEIIKDFKTWTTYFTGFHENRRNIYTAEDHPTGIAHRIVNVNLPRFINNLDRYHRAVDDLGVDFSEVEKTLGVKLADFFQLSYFNHCLTQEGIDQYNLVRGGVTQNQETKTQGINEVINLSAQQLQHSLAKAQDEEKEALNKQIRELKTCKLEEIYKQILSDRSKISFRLKAIASDGELVREIEELFPIRDGVLWGKLEATDPEKKEEVVLDYPLADKLESVIQYLGKAKLEQIYLNNDLDLKNISQEIFGQWDIISRCLEDYFTAQVTDESKKIGKKGLTKKQESEIESCLKKPYYSLAELDRALSRYGREYVEKLELQNKLSSAGIIEYFQSLTANIRIDDFTSVKTELMPSIKNGYREVCPVMDRYRESHQEELRSDKENVKLIKDYLDAVQNLFRFIKPFDIGQGKRKDKNFQEAEKDGSFYTEYDEVIKSLRHITALYNGARNYLTKKPFRVDKFKLNFENNTLGDGWDKNKEPDNTCVILLKDNNYFLGVMNKKDNHLFRDIAKIKGKGYQKMEYKLLPGPNKMLPKVFFADSNIGFYKPSEEIQQIRNTSSHTKGGTPQEGFEKSEFQIESCRKMIDFFKESISRHPEWQQFDFEFRATSEYNSIDEFYREVEHRGYQVNFSEIREEVIDQWVNEGKLYLFQIYSKDFSKDSTGLPNLQTLYWKSLFDQNNLADVVYKLNGEIELFHRRASLTYNQEIWEKGHHYKEPEKCKSHPIIKDKRYAVDTYLFHVPITLNFKGEGLGNFNHRVNSYLHRHPGVNIIGIDRGERHLAYYTLINQKGEIIKDAEGKPIEGSLNNPLGKKDFHELLNAREVARDKARKSWETIEPIKDIKEGYLSQVVHKIASLMVEYNAIVVLEDLNFGFKKGRFRIEKQIYQKLEKMLITKLNYLVFKDKEPSEQGGVMKALQLTAPFESFQKLGKQSGFLFYVPAYHTSKVCPTTGFVNLLYPQYKTTSLAKKFFEKFDKICYNPQNKYFEFHFNYQHFTNKAEGSRLEWTLCTKGSRLVNFRNREKNQQWETKEESLTDELKKIFIGIGIPYEDGHCLIDEIIVQEESSFFKSLIYYLRLTLQLRNSRIGTDEDWMLSPVKDEQGEFFDSQKGDPSLPKNADANGAYHIALKGLMMLRQMGECAIDKLDKFKPDLSNKEWYKFIQEKEYLK